MKYTNIKEGTSRRNKNKQGDCDDAQGINTSEHVSEA